MSEYNSFVFSDYVFDQQSKTLKLYYSLDDQINFCETFKFDFDFVDYDPRVLDRAIQSLFFMAGVSYYKTYVPKEIIVKKGDLDKPAADFFSKTYQKGLGEFWYVNNLDPSTRVTFPVNSDLGEIIEQNQTNGLLIGLGGGKDSLVTVEALRNSGLELNTWSLNHHSQLEPLINKVALKHYNVERTIDPLLLELNSKGAMNGHIPISAILASVGLIVAVLSGQRDIVVSNEQTANEPTLTYQGVEINHQYSKTSEFETDFQSYLASNFGSVKRYYSFLRPLSELRIAEIFAKDSFNKYQGIFSSCNRAYTLNSDSLFWCGECPKCAFIFLVLTPFVDRESLESIWGGKNLLLDEALVPTYKELLGIDGDKPLECVGDIKESRAAMRLAQQIYPELRDLYSFDLPENYDYKALSSDEMPEDIKQLFNQFISKY